MRGGDSGPPAGGTSFRAGADGGRSAPSARAVGDIAWELAIGLAVGALSLSEPAQRAQTLAMMTPGPFRDAVIQRLTVAQEATAAE